MIAAILSARWTPAKQPDPHIARDVWAIRAVAAALAGFWLAILGALVARCVA